MSDNPYAAPNFAPYSPPPPNRNAALQKVQGPAIGLMIASGIGVLIAVVSLVLNLVLGAGAAAGAVEGPDNAQLMARGVMGVIGALVGGCLQGAVLFGAMKMKNLQSYGLSMAAAIIAMLPCSICCLAGLPLGIWALVTINDPVVKSSFT